MLTYRLDPPAIRRRALAIALAESAAMLAPAALVTLLLAREGAFSSRPVILAASMLLILAVVRVLGVRARQMRRLAAFQLHMDPHALRITTSAVDQGEEGGELVPLDHLVRVAVRPGQLGGIRLFVQSPGRSLTDLLSIDVPSGGRGFTELRRALGAHPGLAGLRGLEPAGPRLRLVRTARIALLVASLFFVPFLVDDLLRRSRMAAYLAVLFIGLALRWNVRRSSVG